MPVTKRDLPNVQGRKLKGGGYVEPVRPVLFCLTCGATYSASPGDYWSADSNKPLACDDCGEPLELAHRLEMYVPWGQRAAAVKAVQGATMWPEASVTAAVKKDKEKE